MSKLVTGILAHVDAGKTTLSEALLYESGAIRKLGRVDSKDAFLDNNSIERNRGITIFSKQAVLNDKILLIDTPGHVDFGPEMERTLSVLDAAILLINASDGIQSHTKTLWKLLEQNNIPALIFVNKMDIPAAAAQKTQLLEQLQEVFSPAITDFSAENFNSDSFYESIASSDDNLMEKFLNGNSITQDEIKNAIMERKVFPCIFGSALKTSGIQELLSLLQNYFAPKPVQTEPGCFVYKISYDKQNNRLTHLKVTGGILKVKEELGGEKINEVRIYSGEKYDMVKEVQAGEICTVTGLKKTMAGQAFGSCKIALSKKIEPALIYSVVPPQTIDSPSLLKQLHQLEEEFPELKVNYIEETKDMQMMLMGQVQTEVVTQLMKDRYNTEISFTDERIAYKETIAEPVVGVGHYEPLRHYAEVHLKLSPLPQGSGLKFISKLSVDVLDTNWQRLIMTHLAEKQHAGVLTGSPITDMEIEVIAGRAHLKHTEGGDFRQSTYRAIRHGLMQAKSILLEPVYKYEITVPEACTGRVMSDMEKMHGTCNLDDSKAGFSLLSGRCPVFTMKNYMNEVRAYSKGQGLLSVTVDGYQPCHNQEEIVKQMNYNPDADLSNPACSVFCSHGAGFVVPWEEVNNYKHIK